MSTYRKNHRGNLRALLAILLGTTAVGLPLVAAASWSNSLVLVATNVPIIGVPPTTNPNEGVPGTTESPDPVNPNPGPPDTSVDASEASLSRKGAGEDLYVYIVLQKDYKKDAPVAKSTPGVLGKPWRAVKEQAKKPFYFPLMSVSAGNEYYVVGIRKVGDKLEYTSKHPVRVERISK
ncbi:MAG: hypothetical protein ACO1SV_13765 [Fimbriimonas sp.]